MQIFPDPGQEDALLHLSNRCRLLYHFALQEIDLDRNSDINMMIRFLSHNATWTGYPKFVDNLRKSVLNISRSAGCPACEGGVVHFEMNRRGNLQKLMAIWEK